MSEPTDDEGVGCNRDGFDSVKKAVRRAGEICPNYGISSE